ncbi:uncharacterized protein LOC133364999 [Rhineura floridana]|uniref:uncharacterized protein LOC133364999 n=1 Tax=Rhineura floridana TaxID=261503 RepID=UPI002AC88876|nr:uncharacterized protein LOC133364999 [Rhineura floridana]
MCVSLPLPSLGVVASLLPACHCLFPVRVVASLLPGCRCLSPCACRCLSPCACRCLFLPWVSLPLFSQRVVASSPCLSLPLPTCVSLPLPSLGVVASSFPGCRCLSPPWVSLPLLPGCRCLSSLGVVASPPCVSLPLPSLRVVASLLLACRCLFRVPVVASLLSGCRCLVLPCLLLPLPSLRVVASLLPGCRCLSPPWVSLPLPSLGVVASPLPGCRCLILPCVSLPLSSLHVVASSRCLSLPLPHACCCLSPPWVSLLPLPTLLLTASPLSTEEKVPKLCKNRQSQYYKKLKPTDGNMLSQTPRLVHWLLNLQSDLLQENSMQCPHPKTNSTASTLSHMPAGFLPVH